MRIVTFFMAAFFLGTLCQTLDVEGTDYRFYNFTHALELLKNNGNIGVLKEFYECR